MRKLKFLSITIFLLCTASLPAFATVYEFGQNGDITVHEAVDYLSQTRRNQRAIHYPVSWPAQKKTFEKYIQNSSQKYDVDADLIHAVILTESAYKHTALSPKGAQGLMQLMPQTAKRYGVEDAFNPKQNIDGGTHYLRNLLDRYKGNKELALAAYNAGETAVDKYNGVPPYTETIGYIKKLRNILGSSFETPAFERTK